MKSVRSIHCCECQKKVMAYLTNGAMIYPHRPDLKHLPFWQCPRCLNFVGCHHKTDRPTQPLGVIPTPEIREARKRVHATLDPLWQSGRFKRGHLYKLLSNRIGRRYHTADIRSVEEADEIYKHVLEIAHE